MSREIVYSVLGGCLSIWNEWGQRVWQGFPDGGHVMELKQSPDGQDAYILLVPPVGIGAVNNLVKFSARGDVVWRAELPRDQPTDAFVGFVIEDSGVLWATTWSGHRVRLNQDTGCIENDSFTK